MKEIIFILFMIVSINAGVINVPGDYGTIQDGIDAANTGDSVIVQAGTYDPVYAANKDFITLIGIGKPKITLGSISIDTAAIRLIDVNGWKISGLETELTQFGIHMIRCSSVVISDNYIHHHDERSGSYGWGIMVSESDSITIKNNLILSNEFTGMEIGGTDIKVYNNTIGNTRGYEGILVFQAFTTGLKIINNIIFNNGASGIEYRIEVVDPGTIKYNLFWANRSSPDCVNCNCDYTNLTNLDPLFVNAGSGNHSLSSNSPAIDAGDPNFPLDPDGSRADIGAFYFDPSSIPVLISMESPTLNRRPEFKWHSVDDTSSYQVQIDTSISFSSPIVSIIVMDTTFTPLADLPMKTIYWRIGAGAPVVYSNIDSVIIQNPHIPIVIPYMPDPTFERRPTLRWHSVDSASAYHIMIDNDSSFSSAEVSLAVVDTFFTPLSDLPFGKIFWKVKSDLIDEYSAISDFYVQPDTIPFLYRYWGAVIADKRPIFKWRPVNNASSYKIQIDTVTDFTAPVTSIDISDTSFSPLSDLDNGIYYWRVSCDLNFSLFSQIDSVEIDTNYGPVESKHHLNKEKLGIFPTPFNPTTNISFHIPHPAPVIIGIYNIKGQLVETLVDSYKKTGRHNVIWNAKGFSPGIYYFKLTAGNKTYIKKGILFR